jgi:hypothetical protein
LKKRLVGELYIRRQINRSGRSNFHCALEFIQTQTQRTSVPRNAAATAQHERTTNSTKKNGDSSTANLELEGDNESDSDNDDDDNDDDFLPDTLLWHESSHKHLASLLSKYGLDINALERVIITQHRRAVEVADPKKLVQFIEQLIGGGGVHQELETVTAEVVAAEAEERRLDAQYDVLISKSEELNPALRQWKRFNESKLEYSERVAIVCKKKAVLLEKEAISAGKEAEEAEKHLEMTEITQETNRIKADEMLLVKEEAEKVAEEAAAEQWDRNLHHQRTLDILERVQVRERAAAQASKKALHALSSTVAAILIGADAPDQQKKSNTAANSKKSGKGGAPAAAKKLKEQLEKKTEKLENQQEMGSLEEKLKLEEQASNETCVSKEVLAARAAWKEADKIADAAAATAQTAAEKSSEANSTASNALFSLQKHEKVENGAQIAVKECNDVINSSENELLSLENEEKEALAAAQAAERELAAHQIEAMKLENTLRDSSKALEAAGIDEDDASFSGVLPNNNKNVDAGGSSETRFRQSVDDAVASLAQQAHHDELNPLTGAFHGRYHSVLRVLSSDATTAANAVLLEKCNPASSLVTSTRTAAEAVVGYFTDNKVGRVSCTVLEELRGKEDSTGAAASASADAAAMLEPVLNGTPGAICPLSSLIQANSNVAGGSLLSSELFDSWFVVSDPISAAKIIEHDRKENSTRAVGKGKKKNKSDQSAITRRNLVTLCGSLFKFDGEICAPKEDAALKLKAKYFLSSDFVEIGGFTATACSSKSDADFSTMVENLKNGYANAVAAVEEHERGASAIHERTSAAHALLSSKTAAVEATKSKIGVSLADLEKERRALRSAQAAVGKAHTRHAAAAAKAKKVKLYIKYT